MKSVRYFFTRQLWLTAICALALGGCGRTAKNDPAVAMNDFFTELSKQHYEGAYQSASVPMQGLLSEGAFEAIAKDFGLDNYISCTWNAGSIDGKEAHVQGDFVAKTNEKFVLLATLVREDGRWKLYSLETPLSQGPAKNLDIFGRFKFGSTFNEAFTRKMPTDDEIRKLVTATMLKFNEGLHEKNFKVFYDDTATTYQAQIPEVQIERAFKPYTDQNRNLDSIKDVQLIFTEPPRYDAQGQLLVRGYYATSPPLIFQLQYVFELPRWKMSGISFPKN